MGDSTKNMGRRKMPRCADPRCRLRVDEPDDKFCRLCRARAGERQVQIDGAKRPPDDGGRHVKPTLAPIDEVRHALQRWVTYLDAAIGTLQQERARVVKAIAAVEVWTDDEPTAPAPTPLIKSGTAAARPDKLLGTIAQELLGSRVRTERRRRG